MASSGLTPDGSSSNPDDINNRLDEIAAELSAASEYKEPSADERARTSVRPTGGAEAPKQRLGGRLQQRRNKRLAAELRKPVLLPGQKAPPPPPKAPRQPTTWPRPAPDRGYATPSSGRGQGRSIVAVIVVALVIAGFFALRFI